MPSAAPSRRPRSTYHHGNLRPALVSAGVELLEAEGVEALTLRAVARRAGVSHGAPYNHFADRQALLAAVATEGFEQLGASIATAAAGVTAPRERLRALARGYLAFPAAHPELYRLMFGNEIRDRAAHPELVAADDAIAGAAREATAACLALSARRPVATEMASAAGWALVHGLAALLIDDQIHLPSGRVPDAAFQEEVADLFLDAMIPEDALAPATVRTARSKG
ncbi:MAG: TetR/AcrR family transcriptional regulator [Myxococcota bacterium]|nr:TetR/AcrR family transcriptional regulator [Myxococcota bacterium]